MKKFQITSKCLIRIFEFTEMLQPIEPRLMFNYSSSVKEEPNDANADVNMTPYKYTDGPSTSGENRPQTTMNTTDR